MTFHAWKPETVKRHADERKAQLARNLADTRRRLAEKAEAEPEGIWSELLAEHDERNA
jgi:hypothetical protein